MYSRKGVGPRMESWETPVLTEYSCEEFPSRTTPGRLLLTKDKTGQNMWPKILDSLSFWRRPACQIQSKALGISSARAQVVPDR